MHADSSNNVLLCLLYIIDIDECETANGGCEHNCINIPNSYECACSDGFALKTDQKTCQGI